VANFRRNHNRRSNPFGGLTLKVLLIFGILIFLFFGVQRLFDQTNDQYQSDFRSEDVERDYLPSSNHDLEVLHHRYYSFGYSEKEEQSFWVSYVLTKGDLQVPNVKRWKDYLLDPIVPDGSAHYKDYSNSGYTRGHLAPAGDMAFNKTAMKESFYMSNISPQKRELNNGIWKELEETVRDWGYDDGQIYITTGPVPSSIRGRIGRNRVGTPKLFYKAILDNTGREKKAIGFVIPNERCEASLSEYAMSIDDLENEIGMDLFSQVYASGDEENLLESNYDLRQWKFSKKRYRLRVDKWNNQ